VIVKTYSAPESTRDNRSFRQSFVWCRTRPVSGSHYSASTVSVLASRVTSLVTAFDFFRSRPRTGHFFLFAPVVRSCDPERSRGPEKVAGTKLDFAQRAARLDWA